MLDALAAETGGMERAEHGRTIHALRFLTQIVVLAGLIITATRPGVIPSIEKAAIDIVQTPSVREAVRRLLGRIDPPAPPAPAPIPPPSTEFPMDAKVLDKVARLARKALSTGMPAKGEKHHYQLLVVPEDRESDGERICEKTAESASSQFAPIATRIESWCETGTDGDWMIRTGL